MNISIGRGNGKPKATLNAVLFYEAVEKYGYKNRFKRATLSALGIL